MFGIKKLNTDLYWLRKRVETLESELLKVKSDLWRKDHKPEFKEGDKIVYHMYTNSSRMIDEGKIIRISDNVFFNYSYWVNLYETGIKEVPEHNLTLKSKWQK